MFSQHAQRVAAGIRRHTIQHITAENNVELAQCFSGFQQVPAFKTDPAPDGILQHPLIAMRFEMFDQAMDGQATLDFKL